MVHNMPTKLLKYRRRRRFNTIEHNDDSFQLNII